MADKSDDKAKADDPKAKAADPAAGRGGPGDLPSDQPGKDAEPAAAAGAAPAKTPGMAPRGQGAQVVLTGDAQAAARGGVHAEILPNTRARDQAIASGHVAEGTTAAAARDAMSEPPAEDEQDDRAPAKQRSGRGA